MEGKKLTDEVVVAKNAITDEEIAKAILQQIEYNAGIPYIDEWLKVKTIKFTDILNFIHRLQAENKELKSPKFASWKLKFFNLKEEFDKELAEHEEFTKKAKAEIERLTEKQNDYRANTELFRNSCKFWEEKFQGAMQVNDELQKQADELKEERENMQAVIFGLEEDKRLLQKQVDELEEENGKLVTIGNGFALERNNLREELDDLKKSGNGVLLTSLYKKQADDHKRGLSVQRAYWEKKVEQAVKETAKEILQELWDETEPLNESHKWVRLRIKNIASRKGVEVE